LDFWEKQIRRADQLASTSGSNELLVFYSRLLRAQGQVEDHLSDNPNWCPGGAFESNLSPLRLAFPIILKAVEEAGPASLAEQARALQTQTTPAFDEMLLSYWYTPSDTDFFAKALVQAYGRYMSGSCLVDKNSVIEEQRCPHCGGKPQLSFLQNREVTAESGNRDLLCAKCLWSWPFRRVVCANCGEEEPAKLAYFQTQTIDHVRVEACETCKHYLKSVDLTRLGTAQPLVDEVAAAPLDLWATEHGYTKIELNLVGL